MDLTKVKSIKVTSDGTANGTTLKTNQGDIISTVVGLQYTINIDEVAARLKLEVVLPALELEIPIDNVELEIASIKHCPECNEKLSPTITSRVIDGEEGEDAKQESIVIYECKDCDLNRTYPFAFDWESIPEDLSEYNNDDNK